MLSFHYIQRVFLAIVVCFPIALLAQTNCQADHIVLASNFEFTPNELVILPGESVAFINVEGNHTINGITNTLTQEPYNNPFDFFFEETEGVASGVCMGVVTFDVAGTYNFDCSLDFNAQLGMTGTIIVDGFTFYDVFFDTNTYLPGIWQTGYAFNNYLPEITNGNDMYTIFAPTDQAVDEIREIMNLNQFDMVAFYDMIAALEYTVVEGVWMADDLSPNLELPTLYGQNLTIYENGGEFYADSAKIISTDYLTDNGVIHVIDKCLAPAGLPSATVFDIIEKSPDHTILESGLIKVNLKEKLREQDELDPSIDMDGPFTVIAPTDDAILTLIEGLGMSESEFLNSQILDDVVFNHVFANEYESDELFNNQLLLNWGGSTNQVSIDGSDIFIDGVLLSVTDIYAYNGVVHVIDAVLVPDLPPTSGTCGTWKLILNGYNGWDGSTLDVYIDGELLSSETVLTGNTSSFEFGVDKDAVIDLYYVPISGSSQNGYALYDGDNNLVVSSAGTSNNWPQSTLGVKACTEEPLCGQFIIEMYDDYGDGWDYGYLRVFKNDVFIDSYYMPYGYGPQKVLLATDPNDVIDIEYVGGVYQEENAYKVIDQNGTLIVDQFDYQSIPQGALDIIACESTTSTSEASAEATIKLYPNPSNGIVNLEHAEQIESVIVSDLQGRNMKPVNFNNGFIDCSNYPIGNYLLKIKLANTVEYHKFSIVR
jgi:uncharacterized surface protein with fasciclin (FAS1) repeats/plastocyanin